MKRSWGSWTGDGLSQTWRPHLRRTLQVFAPFSFLNQVPVIDILTYYSGKHKGSTESFRGKMHKRQNLVLYSTQLTNHLENRLVLTNRIKNIVALNIDSKNQRCCKLLSPRRRCKAASENECRYTEMISAAFRAIEALENFPPWLRFLLNHGSVVLAWELHHTLGHVCLRGITMYIAAMPLVTFS